MRRAQFGCEGRTDGDAASHVVPHQGDHWRALKMVRAYIAYTGHSRVILKSGQGPSIAALKDTVIDQLEKVEGAFDTSLWLRKITL